jgi:hypothetical protein
MGNVGHGAHLKLVLGSWFLVLGPSLVLSPFLILSSFLVLVLFWPWSALVSVRCGPWSGLNPGPRPFSRRTEDPGPGTDQGPRTKYGPRTKNQEPDSRIQSCSSP